MIEDIPLLPPDEKGVVPKARLKNPDAARQIHTRFREDDEPNAYNRMLTQDLLDGGLPYDKGVLAEEGMEVTNLNFGGAEQQLERSRNPYYKLIQSPEKLLSTPTLYGAAEDRGEWEDIMSEEITRTIRGAETFSFQSCRLIDKFIWDGVGFSYFPDGKDFRYRSGGLGQFFFARGTEPTETEHEVITMADEYTVTRLHKCIQNEEQAKANGWDVDAVKRAIMQASTQRPDHMDWEKLSEELKNNDLATGYGSPKVPIIHIWVMEFDGTVSHYMTTESGCGDKESEKFLYQCRGKYKSMSSALVIFPYGNGTNSKIHGIRGLGYKIYEFEHQRNRSLGRAIDCGYMASSLMLKATDENSYGSAGYQMLGNAGMLAPGVDVAQVTFPDLTRSVMPVLSEMERLRNDRVSGYTSENTFDGDQRKTKFEIAAKLEQNAQISDVEQDYFYNPFERTVQEQVRRMTSRTYLPQDPGGREIADLKLRLVKRGVPLEAFYMLDVKAIKVIRAIGAGSAAAKTMALSRMESVYPRLDDVGKDNYDRDLTVDAVGTANADRYKPAGGKPRLTVDTSIAILQNTALLAGDEIPVLPSDRHLVQAREHIKPLLDFFEVTKDGKMDEMVAQEAVRHRLLYQHAVEHVDAIDGDPATLEEAAALRQILQQIGEPLENGVKEAQRLAEESVDQEQPSSGPSAKDVAELEKARAKIEIMRGDADVKRQIMLDEAATRNAVKDAEGADSIRRKQAETQAKIERDKKAPAKKATKKAPVKR